MVTPLQKLKSVMPSREIYLWSDSRDTGSSQAPHPVGRPAGIAGAAVDAGQGSGGRDSRCPAEPRTAEPHTAPVPQSLLPSHGTAGEGNGLWAHRGSNRTCAISDHHRGSQGARQALMVPALSAVITLKIDGRWTLSHSKPCSMINLSFSRNGLEIQT